MKAYGAKIQKSRERFFKEYSNQHPLTPLHYIVDLGSNSFMQSIIISVQIQYIDFKTIGFQRRNFTDHLYTIEAMTEEQFIQYLYSHSIKNEEEFKSEFKKLIYALDKDWAHDRKQAIKKDKNKNKNISKNTEDEEKNIEKEPMNIEKEDSKEEKKIEKETETTEKSISIDSQRESDPEDEELKIEKDKENDTKTDDLKLEEIDCTNEQMDALLIHPGTDITKKDEEGLILQEDYEKKLEDLQKISSDYSFDHLKSGIFTKNIENEFAVDDYEFNFDFKKLDKFNHKNWIQWKYINQNGRLVRKFAARKTAEKVRLDTAQSMARSSMQTKIWAYDNEDALDLEHETRERIKGGQNVKLLITSEEDQNKTLRRKLANNKWQPLDDDAQEEEEKNKNKPSRGRKPIPVIKVEYDNTFAHLVTSDAGLFCIFFVYFYSKILYF